MAAKYPLYTYLLAMTLGIMIIFIPDIQPFPYILGLIYFICGLLFGILWPNKSWRWGLWIVGPMLSLMLLSVAFAGISGNTFEDSLLLFLPITSACLGSFIDARFKSFKNNGLRR